jgi:hypothetical protein
MMSQEEAIKVIPLHQPSKVVFSRDIVCDEMFIVERYLEWSIKPEQPQSKPVDKVEYTPAKQLRDMDVVVKQEHGDEGHRTRSGRVFNRLDQQLNAAFHGVIDVYDDEPRTIRQAMRSEDSELWTKAIHSEIEILREHNTWDTIPVDCPGDVQPINCNFIFKKKRDGSGKVIKYKARLVAKGYSQERGVDFVESFSPVIDKTSLRIFWTIAASQGMRLIQFDVPSAFTLAELEEVVFVKLPKEFFPEGDGKVYRLEEGIIWSEAVSSCIFQVSADDFCGFGIHSESSRPMFSVLDRRKQIEARTRGF